MVSQREAISQIDGMPDENEKETDPLRHLEKGETRCLRNR